MAVRCRRRRLARWRSISARATSPLSASRTAISAIGAAGALLGYAAATQQSALAHVRTLAVETASEYLALDAATRRNLEITETLRGEPAPTLLSLLDACGTPAGSRLLRHWLTHPLRSQAAAAARHDADRGRGSTIAPGASALAQELARTADVERIAARIALASARPRDLAGLRDTLARLPAIVSALGGDTTRRSSRRSPLTSTSIRAGPYCSRARSPRSRRRRSATAA